jgi:hypothetical protein
MILNVSEKYAWVALHFEFLVLLNPLGLLKSAMIEHRQNFAPNFEYYSLKNFLVR